ncbi:unnamed protein product, partial [Allacma fusca]
KEHLRFNQSESTLKHIAA